MADEQERDRRVDGVDISAEPEDGTGDGNPETVAADASAPGTVGVGDPVELPESERSADRTQ